MNRWLAAAEALIRRRTGEPPPPWQVECACGRVATGQRLRVAQTPVCPDCRTSFFILPASVYPRPRLPRRRAAAAPPPQTEFVSPIKAESAGEPGPAPRTAGAIGLKSPVDAPVRRAAPRVAHRTLRQAVREWTAAIDFDRLRRKVLTPVRLVLAGVFAVVALTAWWIVHLRALDRAERTVVAASRLGEQAVMNNDLAEAARQFRMVRSSLDLLGRNDRPSRLLRQTADELMAAAELSHASLFDMLREAGEADAGQAGLTWAETFRLSYRHSWVVLDVPVTRAIGRSGGYRFNIDFPLPAGRDRGTVVGDLAIFEKAVAADGSPTRVIFAAQLDDCRRDPEHKETWKIALRPETGFLWSNADRLELLGVGVDDVTRRVLEEQSGLLGISE